MQNAVPLLSPLCRQMENGLLGHFHSPWYNLFSVMKDPASTLTSGRSSWRWYHPVPHLKLKKISDLTDADYRQIHLSEKLLMYCKLLKWQKLLTTLLQSGLSSLPDFVHNMTDEHFLFESLGAQIRYVESATLTRSSSLYSPFSRATAICCCDSTINFFSNDGVTLVWHLNMRIMC